MAFGVLISAWLVGALGGLHCLAMCGGFMAAIAARDGGAGGATAPLLPVRAIVRQQLGYHAGRVATYMLLGTAFGAAGAAALEAANLLPVQRAMYVIANVFLLLLGLSLATRTVGVAWLQRVGVSAFACSYSMSGRRTRRVSTWWGTIFDRVWIEGNPDNQWRGAQTVLLGSSNAAIVEFVVPEAGSYAMVDHHFANASQGAIGLIAAGAPAAGAGESEHHNIPATATPSDPVAVKGKLSFESKCLACHSIGGGDKLGPDLYGVSKRRSDVWLGKWLKSPEQMLQTDTDAKTLLDKYKLPMPNQNLSDVEIREFTTYFKWADTNLRPQGQEQPQPAAPGAALPPNKTLSGSRGDVNPAASEGSTTAKGTAPSAGKGKGKP